MGLEPWDFTFWQLVYLREGKEREEWERLSFMMTTISAIAGNKNAKIEDFNKFSILEEEKKPKDTKSAMASLRHHFK